jgi:hypothetical protein
MASASATDPSFNSFWENPFDLAFTTGSSASLVLRGGEDASMSVSRSAVALGVSSGSSSAVGGASGAFLASGAASLPLATPLQSAPMMLFPSGHTTASLAAGSQRGAPGSLGASPALASGPLVPLCSDPICLGAPAYVPVNADDDNGSGAPFGIPDKRDFAVNPIAKNDPQLLSATLTADPTLGAGTWSITTTYNPPGALIALWTDQKKTAKFFPGGLGTMKFYIEGVHESSALNDVTLTFQYTVGTPPNQTIYSASAKITVTPLINSFTITPAPPQNINFINGVDATGGMRAANGATPGGTFNASVTYTNLPGNLVFIQNFMKIINGYNGTTLNGKPIGYLYAAGSNPGGANLILARGAFFPILDVPAMATIPEYTSTTLQSDGNTYTIQSNDSPRNSMNTAVNNIPVPGPQAGVVLDMYYSLNLWLLWKYPATTDGAGNPVPPVYYPVAVAGWSIEWLANSQNPNGTFNPNGPVMIMPSRSLTESPLAHTRGRITRQMIWDLRQ